MVSGIGTPGLLPYSGSLERTDAPAGNGQNAASATLVAANAHREASGQLSIVTQEGDTVTLSAHLEADATYASFRSRGAQASYLSLESSSSIAITVQGDLSEQEMKDIEKLVKQFGHELRQFFRGSEGADAADVGKGSFSTLAGMAVQFETESSLTGVAVRTSGRPSGLGWSPTPPPISPAGSPDDLPANPAGAVDESADAPANTTVAPVAIDPALEQAIAQLVSRLDRLMQHSNVEPEKALKALNRLLDKLSDAIGEGDDRRHVLDRVRGEVNHERPESAEHDGDEDDASSSPARPAPTGN